MKRLFDCYFLVNSRNKEKALEFLNSFLSERQESASEYPIPIFSNSAEIKHTNVFDLMSFLEKNSKEPYSLYWESKNESTSIKHAMLFYTNDEKLIYGVSIIGNSLEDENLNNIFSKIKIFLDSSFHCITFEEVPPENSTEFISFCKNRFHQTDVT